MTGGFDQFWARYPRREKKQAARDAFAWAMKKHNADGELLTRILDTLAWQAERQPDTRYWQMADKWLLGCRWEDERPLTADERVERANYKAWRAQNAHDPDAATVSFEAFQHYQRARRRA